ncbi:unnamed protein product [Prunus armeniaca]|uniref:PPM-type phosphatase domain-containing protein n=1 Tax=Prunus armeniaca TaxID=36596 RepID=A0A6J5X6V1_PRUAR|nr:unnamed protein product [Prunus armeniaca]
MLGTPGQFYAEMDGVAKQKTVDHDLEKAKEKDLVESTGGFVLERPGNIPHVDGQLAMTRGIYGRKTKYDQITSEADVKVKKIDNETDFIILASDGLWKVMSNLL